MINVHYAKRIRNPFTTSFSNTDTPSSFGRNFNITVTHWQENSSVGPYKTFLQEYYSGTPLFRTRLIRSLRYFEGRSNFLGFTLMFSVIYYQLFRTRFFRIPRYFELIVLSLHLKSTPLFWTCQKQSTYIRAQLVTYCILFELVLRN